MSMHGSKIEVDRFDENGDFSLWKKRMFAHLSVLGLKDALVEQPEVSIPADEKEDAKKTRLAEEAKRLERAEKAMNLIILNVGDHVLRKLDACTTAASIWSTLERLYLSKSLPNRIHLQHKFYTFSMIESRTVDENVDDFLKIVSALNSINVSVSEEVQAILLLNSLPSQFNQLKETLKYGRRETLSLDEVVEAARSKEIDIKEALGSQKSGEVYAVRGRPEKKEPFQEEQEQV